MVERKSVKQMLEEIGMINNLPMATRKTKLEQIIENANIANNGGAVNTLKKDTFPKGEYKVYEGLICDYCEALYHEFGTESYNRNLTAVIQFLDGIETTAFEPLLISNMHRNLSKTLARLGKRKTDLGKSVYSVLSDVRTALLNENRIYKHDTDKFPAWLDVQLVSWDDNPLVEHECILTSDEIKAFAEENPTADIEKYKLENTTYWVTIPSALITEYTDLFKAIKDYLDTQTEYKLWEKARFENIPISKMVENVEFAIGNELANIDYNAKFFGVEEKEELKKQTRIQNASNCEYGSTWQKRYEKSVATGLMPKEVFDAFYIEKDTDGYKSELKKIELENAEKALADIKAKNEKKAKREQKRAEKAEKKTA